MFYTLNTYFHFVKIGEVLIIEPVVNKGTSDIVKICLPFRDHIDMIIDFFEKLLAETIKYGAKI
jgi:hypothetical protein